MSGLSFSLGAKRPGAPGLARAAPAAKKPATVKDLFAPDSDDEDARQKNKNPAG